MFLSCKRGLSFSFSIIHQYSISTAMKKLYLLLMFSLPSICYGQFNFQQKYIEAENAIKENKIEEAYLKLKELEQELPQTDSLYVYVLWNQVQVVTHLEQAARLNQDFEKSLRYGLEALEFIKMGTLFFDDELLHNL